MSMRMILWFTLPLVDEAPGRQFQNLIENRVQQNDRDYVLDFLKALPNVAMAIAEDCFPEKEPPA